MFLISLKKLYFVFVWINMGLCVNLFEFNNKLLWYIWYYNDKFEKYLNLKYCKNYYMF